MLPPPAPPDAEPALPPEPPCPAVPPPALVPPEPICPPVVAPPSDAAPPEPPVDVLPPVPDAPPEPMAPPEDVPPPEPVRPPLALPPATDVEPPVPFLLGMDASEQETSIAQKPVAINARTAAFILRGRYHSCASGYGKASSVVERRMAGRRDALSSRFVSPHC
jgi:hypothetical protein